MARPLPTNKTVREAMKLSGLRQYQIAEKLGYTESTFSKMLRKEMSVMEQKDLVQMILNLSK